MNGTLTKISHIEVVAYNKIPEGKRENQDKAYLCRVFIRSTWSYADSNRIFKLNDIINCYISNQKVFVRIDNIYSNF
jgi:predicted RNA-binding protein